MLPTPCRRQMDTPATISLKHPLTTVDDLPKI
jgi:hypothetical protein